jgi:hypothetical protein
VKKQALSIQEKVYGAEHPEAARLHHDVAHVLLAMGRLDEAEPHFECAVDAFEKSLGLEHPQVRSETVGEDDHVFSRPIPIPLIPNSHPFCGYRACSC